MKIVRYQSIHGREVARLHRMALPLGFLSHLGDDFLSDLYRAIDQATGSGVWVALDEEDSVVGFVSGTVDVKRCYKEVLWSNWYRLLLRVFPSLWSFSTIRRLLETLRYPFQSSSGENPAARALQLPGELLSIAISETARGQGAGRALVNTLESALIEWGYQGEYRVITYGADPRSNSFYLSLGYRPAGEFLHHEHIMSAYTKAPSSIEQTTTEMRGQ